MVQALTAAHNRGVSIRVITDNTRMDDAWVAQLRGSGIVVRSDSISSNSSNYMHNKFVIRDLADDDSTNDWLWIASYNPNEGELNADCAMGIPGTSLAQAYRAEFEQMWGGSGPQPNPAQARFHTGRVDVLPSHRFTVNGSPAWLYFAPQDRVVDTITSFAARAERELAFAVNSFTYDDLGDEMLALWNQSERVFGTFDRANVGDSVSEYYRLRRAGVRVLIDSVPYGSKTLHEKIMVIDSAFTVTGSANRSNNANYSNDENTLILSDAAVANRFHAEVVTRYIEAGGTYAPALTELPLRPLRRSLTPLPSPGSGALPPSIEVFDAVGRRTQPYRLGTGVYFAWMPGRAHGAALIVIR